MEDENGFTLIELIIVFVIIGVLTAIAVPKYTDMSHNAQAAQCKANQAAVEAATSIAYADSLIAGNGVFPATLNGSMFRNGSVPACPTSGVAYAPGSGYAPSTGLASCPTSIAGHAR